jgi:hypothetical protein
MPPPTLPDEIREAINAVLEYNWADEQEDYERAEQDPRGGHIFEKLVRVNNWLNPDDPAELPDMSHWDEEAAEEDDDAEGD